MQLNKEFGERFGKRSTAFVTEIILSSHFPDSEPGKSSSIAL